MIIGVILPTLCGLTLLKTAFTDPGIIPRKVHRLSDRNWTQRIPVPPRFQDICLDGTTVRLKFCSTCQIFRPPRSFHCPICDNCVERFDHHCLWIGTCIGQRNYCWFSSFIWLTAGLCVFVFMQSLTLLIRVGVESNKSDNWTKATFAMRQEPVAVFLVFIVFIVVWFVIALCLFHFYLVVLNKTTNEELRGLHEYGSFYSIGIIGNIMHICCMIPDSNVHIHHEALCPTMTCEEIQKQTVCYVNYLGRPKPKDQQRESSDILSV